MTETANPTLDDLKAAARERIDQEAAREKEAMDLWQREYADRWAELMAVVRKDHPYLGDAIDDRASSFAPGHRDIDDVSEGADAPDYTRASLVCKLPFHEPVAFRYRRGAQGWEQETLGGECDLWRVPSEWEPACELPSLAENGEWEYFADLGEALLAAELSYKQKCAAQLKAREMTAQKQQRRAAPPRSVEQRLLDALRDFVTETAAEASEAAEGLEF